MALLQNVRLNRGSSAKNLAIVRGEAKKFQEKVSLSHGNLTPNPVYTIMSLSLAVTKVYPGPDLN